MVCDWEGLYNMTQWIVLTLGWLFIVAPFNYVEPELLIYKQDYDAIAGRYCKFPFINKMYLGFVPSDEDGVLGVCKKNLLGNSFVIEFNRNWWDQLDDSQRRQLVYHELTHCYFDVDHSEKLYHYMNAYMDDVYELDEQVKHTLIDICILKKTSI
jgi:hypothetical protein